MRLAAGMAVVGVLAASPARAEVGHEGDTLPVQIKGAGYGALLGGGAGLIAGLAVGAKADKGDGAIVGVVLGIGLGVVIGAPLGVQSYADDRNGSGQKWGTTLGSFGGILAAIALGVGMRNSKPSPPEVIGAALMMVGCVMAGPIIGYRASATGTPNLPPTTAFVVPITGVAF